MPADISNSLLPVVALAPVAGLKNDTNGLSVNRTGFEGVDFTIALAATGDTLSGTVYFDFHLQDSDDGTNWSDVAAQFVLPMNNSLVGSGHTGSIAVLQASSANAAPQTLHGGYVGIKKFVRLVADINGTMTNGTNAAAIAILGRARRNPPALGLNP